MGYYSKFEGKIDLNKPLSVKLAKVIGEIYYGVFEVNEDGTSFSCSTDSTKWYDWEEEIVDTVKMLAKDKYVANGEITREGEEFGHGVKAVIKDNVVVFHDAEVVYEPREPKPAPAPKRVRGRRQI